MRKFLSMVLALVMAMSLVTFAAPAAQAKDFTDEASITNKAMKEAIDVISAIEVMDGRSDGSFAPTESLTRQAAAKIICNMILGPAAAKNLPANVAPFPDVAPNTEWAGYISYCASHGIISGYADGTFKPTGNLSGYAFLKMLLGALGYDQELEGYVGANWRVNVSKQAIGIGLDDGLGKELDAAATVTREEAALYAFNTLQSDLVEYDAKTNITVNGAQVSIGNSTAKVKTWNTSSSQSSANNIDDAVITGNSGAAGAAILQFAEQYFNRLVKVGQSTDPWTWGDAFGRPSTTWYYRGDEIGTYEKDADKTYYSNKKINEIYTDLKMSTTAVNWDDLADGIAQGGARLFVNGIPIHVTGGVSRTNDRELTDLGQQNDWTAPVWNPPVGVAITYPGDAWSIANAIGLRSTSAANSGAVGTTRLAFVDRALADGTRVSEIVNPTTAGAYSGFAAPAPATCRVAYKDANGRAQLWDGATAINNLVVGYTTDADETRIFGAADANYSWPIYAMDSRLVSEYLSQSIGDGTVVEVFRNADYNGVTICAESVYAGQISGVRGTTTKKDDYVIVERGLYNKDGGVDVETTPFSFMASDTNDEYETTAFAEDDIVAFKYSERTRGIEDMYKMQSVEGTLSRYLENDYLQIAGNNYNYAKGLTFYELENGQYDLINNNEYVVYMDDQGNALWVQEAEFAIERYALLTRITSERTVAGKTYTYSGDNPLGIGNINQWNGNQARLVFSNGAQRTVALDKAYTEDSASYYTTRLNAQGEVMAGTATRTFNSPTATGVANNEWSGLTLDRDFWLVDENYARGNTAANAIRVDEGSPRYMIVRHTLLDDGTYRLRAPEREGKVYYMTANNTGAVAARSGFSVWNHEIVYGNNGGAGSNWVDVTNGAIRAGRISFDSKTVFVVSNGDSYRVYTGLRNAPNVTADGGQNTYVEAYVYVVGNAAKLVYTVESETHTTSKDVTFISGSSRSNLVEESGLDEHYLYWAVVNGVPERVMVKSLDDGGHILKGFQTLNTNDEWMNDLVPGWDGAADGVILNRVERDDDNIIENGWYDITSNNDIRPHYAWGIKRASNESVKVDTFYGGGNETEVYLTNDCRIWLFDGDATPVQITIGQIDNDVNDCVYYTTNEGDINNLFIVKVDDDKNADAISHYGTGQNFMDNTYTEAVHGGVYTATSQYLARNAADYDNTFPYVRGSGAPLGIPAITSAANTWQKDPRVTFNLLLNAWAEWK